MNKAELIEALSAHYNGSKAEAGKALNAVVETITHKTAAGEKVSITGFGVFEKVQRSARMVRNPRTGERKRAKATAVPRFRAGTELKAFVSGAKKVPKAAAVKKSTPVKATAAAITSAVSKTAAKTVAAATTKAPTIKATKATPAKTVAKKANATKATTPAAKKTVATKKAPATKAPATKSSAETTTTAKKSPTKKATAKR